MTALQDWLGVRHADQSGIVEFVCRPLRAVLSIADRGRDEEFTMMSVGLERC